MVLLRVDDIMKTPVHTIDDAKTGEQAIQAMLSKDPPVKKILVTSQGKPIGVLEKWKITEVDKDQPIKRLELSPFKVVPVGTDLSEIKSDLREYAAVYVFNPTNPQKLVGVVTAYDYATAL